jgi:hypothetical protein
LTAGVAATNVASLRTVRRSLPIALRDGRVVVTLAVAFVCFQQAFRYGFVQFSDGELGGDTVGTWLPLAEAVHAGGTLYQVAPLDNKPPVFQFLNLIAYSTGHYHLAWMVILAALNAIAIVALYRLARRHASPEVAAVTLGLFLATIPVTDATIINPRQLATAGILVALVIRRPVPSGVALAVGGLSSQYAGFALPVLAYYGVRVAGWDRRDLVVAGFTGLATVVAAYGTVAAIWSVGAAVDGIRLTILIAPGHVLGMETVPFGTDGSNVSPVLSPFSWAGAIAMVLTRTVYLAPALLAAWRVRDPPMTARKLGVVGATFLLLPLGVRAAFNYWHLAMPFLSLLAALGYADVFDDARG